MKERAEEADAALDDLDVVFHRGPEVPVLQEGGLYRRPGEASKLTPMMDQIRGQEPSYCLTDPNDCVR